MTEQAPQQMIEVPQSVLDANAAKHDEQEAARAAQREETTRVRDGIAEAAGKLGLSAPAAETPSDRTWAVSVGPSTVTRPMANLDPTGQHRMEVRPPSNS